MINIRGPTSVLRMFYFNERDLFVVTGRLFKMIILCVICVNYIFISFGESFQYQIKQYLAERIFGLILDISNNKISRFVYFFQ